MNLYRVPKEERELLDKALLVSAMPRVLEMEANLGHVEATMEKLWNNTRDTREMEFQKRELKENRAILAAYKQYYSEQFDCKRQKMPNNRIVSERMRILIFALANLLFVTELFSIHLI
jgi:hypothetical protein